MSDHKHLGFDYNQYGTRISKHLCGDCGEEFTICPAQEDGEFNLGCSRPPGYRAPNDPGCTSYDEKHDFDKIIREMNARGEAPVLTAVPPPPRAKA